MDRSKQGAYSAGSTVTAWNFAALAAVVATVGCAQKTPPVATAPPPPVVATAPAPVRPVAPPPVALTHKQQITNALILLNSGQASTARIGIVQILADQPNDPVAKDLLRQIDTDPKTLLGDRSFPYRIRPRETLATIAHRYLGNANRFWALARYNDIAVPADAEVGRVIQVPGVAPARTVAPPVAPPPARAAATTGPVPPVAPAAPVVDPASAERYRRAGLAEMSRGAIDKAVGLLERALSFNPGDAAIQADLARARKVQQTVEKR